MPAGANRKNRDGETITRDAAIGSSGQFLLPATKKSCQREWQGDRQKPCLRSAHNKQLL